MSNFIKFRNQFGPQSIPDPAGRGGTDRHGKAESSQRTRLRHARILRELNRSSPYKDPTNLIGQKSKRSTASSWRKRKSEMEVPKNEA